jgi:hypothetical protein
MTVGTPFAAAKMIENHFTATTPPCSTKQKVAARLRAQT